MRVACLAKEIVITSAVPLGQKQALVQVKS